MKVSELIEELQKMNQDATVVVPDDFENLFRVEFITTGDTYYQDVYGASGVPQEELEKLGSMVVLEGGAKMHSSDSDEESSTDGDEFGDSDEEDADIEEINDLLKEDESPPPKGPLF